LRKAATAARSDDEKNYDGKAGGDTRGGRQFPFPVPLRPVDTGGAALGDERGIEFSRGRISAGQGGAGALGIGFERQHGGRLVIGDTRHPRMLARIR